MTALAPVSVIIPCFRCSKTVERAVQSVANQSLVPAEVILVDDCSGDGTRELLQSLVRRHRTGWIRLVLLDQNMGAASARNAGWAIATQEFVAFLDSDDAWHPEKISIQLAYMQAHPEIVLTGHAHCQLADAGQPRWDLNPWTSSWVSQRALLVSNRFITPSVMVRTLVTDRFIEHQRYMEDHMLWMTMASRGLKIARLSTVLAATYKAPFGASGLSSRIWLMERAELGNYVRLYQHRLLKGYELVPLIIFSLLKYLRRVLISAVSMLGRAGRAK